MFNKIKFLLILISLELCALSFYGKAQSFEWEANQEEGLNEIPLTKIIESNNGELILAGPKQWNNCIYKFNNYGKLIWMVSPKIQGGDYIDNIVSFDEYNTFFMIGPGLPFPQRNNLYQISADGKFKLEKVIYTNTYLTRNMCNRLLNGKIVTGGYRFFYHPQGTQMNPVVEYRSMNGDTLGKFEFNYGWNSQVRKTFLNQNNSEILAFCSQHFYGYLTSLRIDTLGNIIKANFWGGKNGKHLYDCRYYDMVEKNNSYYMLIWLTNSDEIERGTYIYKFNEYGDSVSLTKINGNFNTISSTPDNGFILAEYTLLKLDSNLQVEWEKPFKEGVQIQSIGASKFGGYYGSGRRVERNEKNERKYRTYVFRTNLNGDIETQTNYPELEIYPNPFTDKISIELPFGKKYYANVYNLQGKKCIEYEFTGSAHLNVNNLSQGLYFLHLLDDNKNLILNKKMLKVD